VEQSHSDSDRKAEKQTAQLDAKAEKQPPEHQVQRGQLVQFFSKMAHTATIAGREESWGYQPKKPKSRNRQREADNGLSR
jgi:plastocyanin